MNKQFFVAYTEWEDFKNGMYDTSIREINILNSKRLLCSYDLFNSIYEAMVMVIESWPICSAQNLTNRSVNRKAWIGQAACNIKLNSTESETRKAWFLLSQMEQQKANYIAESVIKEYERKNKETHSLLAGTWI